MLIFIGLHRLVNGSDHPMKLLVYTEKNTPRTDYIFNLVIEDLAGFSFQVTNDSGQFDAYTGPKLAYSNRSFKDAIGIANAGFLEGQAKEMKELCFVMHRGTEVPFAVEGSFDFPFDIFSSAFYLVTRCEEYSTKRRDHHDRFSAYESLAYKKSFLEKPVINHWALELRNKIHDRFPLLTYKKKSAKIISTIDVDQLFAIKARGFKRTSGRLLKQLITFDVKNIVHTLSVLLFNRKDPFDTFDYILSLSKEGGHELIFFMHLGNYAAYDKSIAWNHLHMRATIKKLSNAAFVGIHPSYQASGNDEKLRIEIQRYQELLVKNPDKSRQHYLKLYFPQTYRKLIESKVKEDYTLGYSECIGFRASICTPFKFYDLYSEQTTDLMLFPFAAMDRALKDGMKLSVEESITKLKDIKEAVISVEGLFISLFHNESLSDNKEWKGWRSVYESTFQ